MTPIQLRETLKDIDLDKSKGVSFIELLLWRYKKQVADLLTEPEHPLPADLAQKINADIAVYQGVQEAERARFEKIAKLTVIDCALCFHALMLLYRLWSREEEPRDWRPRPSWTSCALRTLWRATRPRWRPRSAAGRRRPCWSSGRRRARPPTQPASPRSRARSTRTSERFAVLFVPLADLLIQGCARRHRGGEARCGTEEDCRQGRSLGPIKHWCFLRGKKGA